MARIEGYAGILFYFYFWIKYRDVVEESKEIAIYVTSHVLKVFDCFLSVISHQQKILFCPP